jgi:predicted nucleic acid-binding protein
MFDWLDAGEVAMHPFVIGELACGHLKPRAELLDEFYKLPFVDTADDKEVLLFIERYSLMGKGVGYVDVHLLASTSISENAQIWSRDKRLMAIATRLDLAYRQA